MMNNSENAERTTMLIADDCVWVMEPGGSEYHGSEEIRPFVETAMSGRRHDATHKVEVLNWFTDGENLCVEYTHGARLTGRSFAGMRGSVKTGVARYCITYHIRDGRFDRVHEYINATSTLFSALSPLMLGSLHRQAERKLAKASKKGARASSE